MRRTLLGTMAALVAMAAFAGTIRSIDSAHVEEDPAAIVHIDRNTGLPTATSASTVPVLLDAQTAAALNTSFDGLRAVPLEGGGHLVHLEGRFQHAFVAVADGQGGLKVTCISNVSPQDAAVSSQVEENNAKTPDSDEGGTQ